MSIKAFDNNVYAVSELTTSVSEPGGKVNVTVEIGSSIVLLPETPMPSDATAHRAWAISLSQIFRY